MSMKICICPRPRLKSIHTVIVMCQRDKATMSHVTHIAEVSQMVLPTNDGWQWMPKLVGYGRQR